MLGYILLFCFLLLIDLYVFQTVIVLLKKKSTLTRRILYSLYWAIPLIFILGASIYPQIEEFTLGRTVRYTLVIIFSINYIPKVFSSIILGISDVLGIFGWMGRKVIRRPKEALPGSPISRTEFVSKVALVSAAAPLFLMGFGIVGGAHDYRIRRKTLYLKNLPSSFDGITVGQISDIHTGSFFNKTAVRGGVDLLLGEKPDVVFFTGDLVNNRTDEVKDYIDIFNKVKAPLGVYSVTGNHDYGDYTSWISEEAKAKNFKDLIEAHKILGYDLILNDHRKLTVNGESIAILGIENWGAGRFQKYGDLKKTVEGTEDFSTKILLSHDPSHWDAQVRQMYPDIDLMLSGHTHGFQMGVEIGDFKWSPSQYIYKQWAGLYKEGDQHLYVNRGYGYIGYPGRIGIPPEITILELKKG